LLLARGYQAHSYVCCGRSLLFITLGSAQCATNSVVNGLPSLHLRAAMLEPPMVRTWVRLITRLWRAGRRGKDVTDARVTFIAGPPREFLRVLSQQGISEPANPPTNQQPASYATEEVTDWSYFACRSYRSPLGTGLRPRNVARAADIATDGTTHLGPNIGGHRCRFYASEAGTTRTSWCRKRVRSRAEPLAARAARLHRAAKVA
jgi:hypothetical protein